MILTFSTFVLIQSQFTPSYFTVIPFSLISVTVHLFPLLFTTLSPIAKSDLFASGRLSNVFIFLACSSSFPSTILTLSFTTIFTSPLALINWRFPSLFNCISNISHFTNPPLSEITSNFPSAFFLSWCVLSHHWISKTSHSVNLEKSFLRVNFSEETFFGFIFTTFIVYILPSSCLPISSKKTFLFPVVFFRISLTFDFCASNCVLVRFFAKRFSSILFASFKNSLISALENFVSPIFIFVVP